MKELFNPNSYEEDVKNYRIPISLSYSRLSDVDRNGPRALTHREVIDSAAIQLGSTVDELLLGDKKSFKEAIVKMDITKPTATSGRLVDILLDPSRREEEITDEYIISICRENDFWKNYSDEKILENVEKGSVVDYVTFMIENEGKDIISTELYLNARTLVDVLRNHSHSKKYFGNLPSNKEEYNRMFMEFEYRGVKFRGESDKIIIDHESKTIQPIDLKTGKDSYKGFMKNYLMFRYYLQCSLYNYAIRLIFKHLIDEGYEMLPFKFIYIGRKEQIPVVFVDNDERGFNGFTTKNGYTYRGVDEILDDIIWYFDNNLFDLDRDISESKGELLINL